MSINPRLNFSHQATTAMTQVITPPLPTGKPITPMVENYLWNLSTDDGQTTRICEDLDARTARGIATYGSELRLDSPIDALQELYEEKLDAMQYCMLAAKEENDLSDSLILHMILSETSVHVRQIRGLIDKREQANVQA